MEVKKLHVIGAVPYSSFKEKIRITKQLRNDIGGVKFENGDKNVLIYSYVKFDVG